MAYSADFDDLYDIPQYSSAVPYSGTTTAATQGSYIPTLAEMLTKEQEDELIRLFCETSALDWQRQIAEADAKSGYRGGYGFSRFHKKPNVYVRPMTAPPAPIPHGYLCKRCKVPGHLIQHCPTNGNPDYDLQNAKPPAPPEGYLCHRCKVPGHLIQHCPTNGDPNFENYRNAKPPRIPVLMQPTDHGACALPAVSKPTEAPVNKHVQAIPSSSSSDSSRRVIPPELHCPLCKHVMKDAVITSRCCFASFCYSCIRDHIVSNSFSCVCDATNVLVDYLLPNKTLRNTINRYLESNYSSSSSSGSTSVQDKESSQNQFAAKKRKVLDSPSELPTGNKRERLVV